MRRISPKRAEQNKIYEKVKALWRQLRTLIDGYLRCEFAGDGLRCSNEACRHPHHIAGREGERLYDYRYFMALCPSHHAIIHASPAQAYKWGYMILRSGKINIEKMLAPDEEKS